MLLLKEETSTMKKIRIGFIGIGGIARQRHIPGLQKIEGVEFVAVANRTRESGQRAADEFNIPNVCDTWQELVARDDLDAIVIGTWPYLHCPASIAALESGKHVFCQARMAMNYAEAREMYACAKERGRVAMLCPVPFGLSVDATIARLLREGYLGDLRLVRVMSLSDAYLNPETPLNWRKDHRLSGLNALTLGMYIEVVHRWFGWTRSVSARTHIFVAERQDSEGRRVKVQIPDQFLFSTEMELGTPVQYVISGVSIEKADAIDIHGSRATLHYDVGADVLSGAKAGEQFHPIPIRPDEQYDVGNWRVEADFINAIRKGTPYHPDFEDGLRYMQVIQGLYGSAAQGRVIILDDEI
jgi:predicted dehydrogenase